MEIGELNNARYELDFGVIPKMFSRNKKDFLGAILQKKEGFFYEMFCKYYEFVNSVFFSDNPKKFKKEDFIVIEETVSKNKQIIYVVLPQEHEGSMMFCSGYAFTFEKTFFGIKNIQFYTIEQSDMGTTCIGTMTEDRNHFNFGEAADNVRDNINRIKKIAFQEE